MTPYNQERKKQFRCITIPDFKTECTAIVIEKHGIVLMRAQCNWMRLPLWNFLTPFPSYFGAFPLKTKLVTNVSSNFSPITLVTVEPLSLAESLISPSGFQQADSFVMLALFFAMHSGQLPIILLESLFCNEGSWLLEASQNLWPKIYNIYLMTQKKTNKRTFFNIPPRDFPHCHLILDCFSSCWWGSWKLPFHTVLSNLQNMLEQVGSTLGLSWCFAV